MEIIPLEDNFEDVLGKAMRGGGMTVEALSSQSGVVVEEINALLSGSFSEEPLRQISPSLALDGNSLVECAKKSWQPKSFEIEGLRQFISPFEDYTVGAYLVWDPDSMEAAMFDTGSKVDEAYAFVEALGLDVTQLFITHTHPDHILAMSKIKRWGRVTARTLDQEPASGAEQFSLGDEFRIGRLKVSTRLTRGHSPAGVTYVIEGLERPVAIVGDALFAQSMGGGVVSFEAALETNRKEIFTLADDTIVCPGHGPMTTVGEERRFNAFLKS